jgi:hypothetical protein
MVDLVRVAATVEGALQPAAMVEAWNAAARAALRNCSARGCGQASDSVAGEAAAAWEL